MLSLILKGAKHNINHKGCCGYAEFIPFVPFCYDLQFNMNPITNKIQYINLQGYANFFSKTVYTFFMFVEKNNPKLVPMTGDT